MPTCVGMTGRHTWAPENQLCALCAPLCELCVETRTSWAHLRRRFARCEDNLMTEPHRHGRRPWPGIRISEKYGASPSVLSASFITTSSAIVPRST